MQRSAQQCKAVQNCATVRSWWFAVGGLSPPRANKSFWARCARQRVVSCMSRWAKERQPTASHQLRT
eukprot:10423912-Alexandrium_andersonii.AAC.1